jgi:phosphoglycolate phosphatase
MRDITVVFDLDGTLIDTAPDLCAATDHVLDSIGQKPVPHAAITRRVGYGAKAMLETALEINRYSASSEEVDELLGRFLAFYEKNIAVRSRPYPDAPAVLERLRQSGMRLAVCTNKREALSRKLLRELSLDRMFSAIVGRDTLPVCKPDPGHLIGTVILADGNLNNVVMVGDSEVDVQTAKAAGIPVIGVTFGYSAEPIHSYEPDGIIDHYRDLERRVESVLRAAMGG